MPRQARRRGGSEYFHVIVRGIGRQILFEEEADFRKYLDILKRYCQETDIKVCAYCLMTNHVHLLLHDIYQRLPILMKKIGVSYAGYFNRKYDRSGHLFQDRYLSENIENDKNLLTVFRYILRNPEKAGICPAKDYAWSSYRFYAESDPFISTNLFEKMIGTKSEYERYIATENDDRCLEYKPHRHDDIWAQQVIRRYLGGKNGTILQNYDKAERDKMLHAFKEAGISIRRLERLTGINRGVIQKA